MNINEIMENFAKQHEAAMKRHESALEESKRQYEELLLQSQQQLEAMLAEAAPVPSEQTPTATNPTPAPNDIPAAVWIDAPDGEKMMMLNQAAAVMFMAIFERMGEVADELRKTTK